MSKKSEQILLAATDEFLAKGLEAASMHNIAKLAEVSKRTLYKYYPSKEDLYEALVGYILDRIEAVYQFDYENGLDIKELIEQIVEAKIEFTLSDSFLKISKITFGELLKGKVFSEKELSRISQSELLFINWIEAQQKKKTITKDFSADEIANQFHSLLKGQIYWPVLLGLKNKSDLDLQRIKKITVDFFLKNFVL